MLPNNRIRGLYQTPETPDSADCIHDRLRARYGPWLRPDLLGARIVHMRERVFLEMTTDESKADLLDHRVTRTDLAFLIRDGGQMFPASDRVEANAARFIDEMEPYDIIQATDLFRDEACQSINDEYRAGE